MEDTDYLAICIYDEARGEIDDGRAAVGRVVLNRAEMHMFSDGTIRDTVLHKDQFSGFYFDMVSGHYTRVCHTEDEADARAQHKVEAAGRDPRNWTACQEIAKALLTVGYIGGADFRRLTNDTMLYANLNISHPAWAIPAKFVTKVGRHSFFRA